MDAAKNKENFAPRIRLKEKEKPWEPENVVLVK